MVEHLLQGCRILVVEDDYLLADDLSDALVAAGATVLGPVPSIEEAATMIDTDSRIDAAILDINLRGDMVFPVADALAGRGIPFAFATGYDQSVLPERYAARPRVEKPFRVRSIAATIEPLLKLPDQQA